MNLSELKQDIIVEKLFASVNPSPSTWQGYLTALMHYCNYMGMNPSQMIEQANTDIKSGKLMTDRAIFVQIPGFRKYLQKQVRSCTGKPLTQSSVSLYVGKILTFYSYFYIETPKQPRNSNRTNKAQKENLKRPDKELIQKALSIASIRDKAVMLTGISSGMAANEIASLTVEQFNEGYDSETGITTFDMRRQKVGTDFITFISPEASNAILSYLEWRNRPPAGSEECNQMEYEKRKVTNDSYLFLRTKVNKEYLLTRDENQRRLTKANIIQAYKRLNEDLGTTTEAGMFNLLRSHNMRKFFNTQLKNEGMDGDLIEYMMGHKLSGSKSHYYEGDPEKLKKIYARYVPFLTISKEVDVASSPEFQELREKYETEKAAKEHFKTEKYELESMKGELEKFQKAIESMSQ
ncbi:MAG: site-specific integrase [Methanolobus sp.]|nr:site-specific integrase [Methanolobus sp.]